MEKDIEMFLDKVVAEVSKKEEVLALYLFGSFAKGQPRSDSDVDLAVLVDPAHSGKNGLDLQFELKDFASEYIKEREADVVILNDASAIFKAKSIRGKLLYEKNRLRRLELEEKIMRDYDDLKDYLEMSYRYSIASAKKHLGVL